MDKYTKKICISIDKSIDVVFIILAYDFFPENIKELKRTFIKAKFVYYAWDSIKNFPIIELLARECDKVYSFDPHDCKTHDYKFLPLFFVKKGCANEKKFDCCTIMNFYPSKSEGLKKILKIIPPNSNIFKYLVLKSRLYYLYFKIKYKDEFKNFHMNYFKYRPLTRKQTYEIFSNSKVVLDIPLANQNGLTIRTFEALALNCKIITTNKEIKKYEFYSSDNIYVIDDDEELPKEFFSKKFNNKYCLDNKFSVQQFVKTILGN